MDKLEKIFIENELNSGRMISYSKSVYISRNHDNLVKFNACIHSESGETWFGDIDITKSKDTLTKISKELGETLYVLSEFDSFDENVDYRKRYVWNTETGLPEREAGYYDSKTLKRIK